MKKGFFIVITLISIQPIFAQSISPSLQNYPHITTDSLAKYLSLGRKLNAINKKNRNTAFDSLTIKDQVTIRSFQKHFPHYLSTMNSSCSWFCAAEIDTFYSSINKENVAFPFSNIYDSDLRTPYFFFTNQVRALYINFYLSSEQLQLTTITIYNGHCKNLNEWKKYARAKSIDVFIANQKVGTLNLKDTYLGQQFNIGTFSALSNNILPLRLVITDAFGPKNAPIAIAEIEFDGEGDH